MENKTKKFKRFTTKDGVLTIHFKEKGNAKMVSELLAITIFIMWCIGMYYLFGYLGL